MSRSKLASNISHESRISVELEFVLYEIEVDSGFEVDGKNATLILIIESSFQIDSEVDIFKSTPKTRLKLGVKFQ